MVQCPNAKPTSAIKVVVDIRPGHGTPNQCRLWAKFWQTLIALVKAGERCHPQPESKDDAE